MEDNDTSLEVVEQRTLHDLAKLYKIKIPKNLRDLSENEKVISCFAHSCEYGIFPYLEKDERDDYKYWFPIYFDMEITACTFVYLINLHPLVGYDDRPAYACRRIYEGDKGKIVYKQIKNSRKSIVVIPGPCDLKPLKTDHTKKRGKQLYKEFRKFVEDNKLEKTPGLIDPVSNLYELFMDLCNLKS